MFDVTVDAHLRGSSWETLQWKQLLVGVKEESYFEDSSKFTSKSSWKKKFLVQLHAWGFNFTKYGCHFRSFTVSETALL